MDLTAGDEKVEIFCVRRADKVNVTGGLHYGQPSRDVDISELLLKKLFKTPLD